MLKINEDVAHSLVMTISGIAVFTFFLTMFIHLSTREEKCIGNVIHYLVTNEYWQATGFHCTPLSSEETLDV